MSWRFDESLYPGPDESRFPIQTVQGIAMDITPMTVSRWVLYDTAGKIVASGETAPLTMNSDTLTFTHIETLTTN